MGRKEWSHNKERVEEGAGMEWKDANDILF